MIKDIISLVAGKPNLMNAYKEIGKYEMSSIYPDQIIYALMPSASQLFKG